MSCVINIDKSKCVGCGACVKDCVSFHLKMVDGKAEFVGDGCIECGHCYAICPAGAVSMKGYETTGEEYLGFDELDGDKLLLMMKSRRTVRQFKDKKVEKDIIEKIIEAGRYCPTAKNSQGIAYTVIEDKLNFFENEALKIFRGGIKLGGPITKSFKDKIDDNFFFKGAPLVIVVSSKSSVDASLASSYMEIIAESLGLGVMYSGFFIAASMLNPKIKHSLDLPKGFKPVTCMIFGYPDVNYKRVAPRKKPRVKYM